MAESDIDTADYSVRPIYQWSSGRKLGKRLGYHARRNLAVRLRDLSRFGALLARISESGAVSVTSVEPESEETRSHRDEARLLAVRAAREKAQAIAGELGQSLGSAVMVEVDGATSCCATGGERPYAIANVTRNYVEADEEGQAFALGEITLTARVKVAFELK